MKKIPLSQGKFALIDDEDYDRVSANKWSVAAGWKDIQYAVRQDGNKRIYLHRFIVGAERGAVVDHKNHDGLDNRRSNLRLCTTRQNSWNNRTPSNNKTGAKGVFWHAKLGKWMASIRVNSKSLHLGLFQTKEEAASAYEEAAIKYFGQFANPTAFPHSQPAGRSVLATDTEGT